MKVIVPVTITDAMLLSSSIAEDDAPAYAAGTTYAAGAQVVYLHRVYESKQGSNLGKTPSTETAWWTDLGPTARWAMFDERPSTLSAAAASTVTFTVAPGVWVTDIALIDLAGTSARVQVYDSDGTTLLWQQTKPLPGISETSYYRWFFRDRVLTDGDLIFSGLPRRLGARITVTLTGPGSVSLGVAAFGIAHTIGQTMAPGASDLIDYSRVQTDEFGATTITRRARARRNTYQVHLLNADLPRVRALRDRISARMCVFVGDESANLQSAMLAYGLFTRFPLEIAGPVHSSYSLEVQGAA